MRYIETDVRDVAAAGHRVPMAAVLDSFITVYTYARDCDSFSTGTVSVHAAPH